MQTHKNHKSSNKYTHYSVNKVSFTYIAKIIYVHGNNTIKLLKKAIQNHLAYHLHLPITLLEIK